MSLSSSCSSADVVSSPVQLSKAQLQQFQPSKASSTKTRKSGGYVEGGQHASLQDLVKMLNRVIHQGDKAQASAVLTHILQRKLHNQDLLRFGLMKVKILMELGANRDAGQKAVALASAAEGPEAKAGFYSLAARAKTLSGQLWQGYYDFLKAKSLVFKQRLERKSSEQTYSQSEQDMVYKQIDLTQLQVQAKLQGDAYNKTYLNMLHPPFMELKNRHVHMVSCGYYHVLILVGDPIAQPSAPQPYRVFGLGQNSEGQITGYSTGTHKFTSPFLIQALDQKGVAGVHAFRESSLAWDSAGVIYQWGGAGIRPISQLIKLGSTVASVSKGDKHYAALTRNGGYFWGQIKAGARGISFEQPTKIQVQDPVEVVCGTKNVYVVNRKGQLFALGSNELGQCGCQSPSVVSTFTRIELGTKAQKVFPMQDCVFVQTQQQVYFFGRISYKKQPFKRPRPAEFPGQRKILSLSGQNQHYYAMDELGCLYSWVISQSGKFKQSQQLGGKSFREVFSGKGITVFSRNVIEPAHSRFNLVTPKDQIKTYQPIQIAVTPRDHLGDFGLPVFYPLCYQICLTTHLLSKEDLLGAYRNDIPALQSSNTMKIREIFSCQTKGLRVEQEGTKHIIQFNVAASGVYYFYLLMGGQPVQPMLLKLDVGKSEHQEKLKAMQQAKQQQLQMLRKSKEEEERRKRQEDQKALQEQKKRREDTQKRAQNALKRQINQNREKKLREEEERRMKKEMMVGGGFDLSKIQKKEEKKEEERKFGQVLLRKDSKGSQLPHLGQPGQVRKRLSLPKKN